MLVPYFAAAIALTVFVLAFLPVFLGDLLLFTSPVSSLAFLSAMAALVAVLWIIDRVADESVLPALTRNRRARSCPKTFASPRSPQ
jgi:hypothetical protein